MAECFFLQTEHKMSVEEVCRKFQTDIVQVGTAQDLVAVVSELFCSWPLGGGRAPLLATCGV